MIESYIMELQDGKGLIVQREITGAFPDDEEIKDFLRDYGENSVVRIYKEYRLLPFA